MYKRTEGFELHPEGVHEAVVVHWDDMGKIETQYGQKHRAIIKYESLAATRRDGSPHLVFDYVNIAFSEKSKLSQRYLAVTGKPMQGGSFDPQDMLGAKVEIFVVHNHDQPGRTYANIAKVTRCKNQDIDLTQLKTPIGVKMPGGVDPDDPGEITVSSEVETTLSPTEGSGQLPF
jgi:hypothetical protein